jgi:hypothetical protein
VKRLALIAALILAAILISGPAFAATGGVSVDHSQGVLKLGDGTANCSHAADTGTVRFNSSTSKLQYCLNGSGWRNVDEGPGVLISTLTASSSASLQFYGSNWSSSYPTLFLNCSNLQFSIANTVPPSFYIYLGQGAGPTWKTGASYVVVGTYWNGATATPINVATQTATDSTNGGIYSFDPLAIAMYLYGANTSGTWTHYWIHLIGGWFSTADYSGQWGADTNQITGIEIVPISGNIVSGTCSLYGMR